MSCRGRIINKRGYPSAFWQLLHYITAQAEDKEAKRVAEILSEFTSTFYYCDRSGNGIFIRLLLKYMVSVSFMPLKKPIKATSFELAMEEYPPHKVHDTKSEKKCISMENELPVVEISAVNHFFVTSFNTANNLTSY